MLFGMNRKQVEIQKRQTKEAPGGVSETWETQETRWATQVELGLEGRSKYQQIHNTQATHKFIFTGIPSFDLEDYRIKLGDDYYEFIEPPGNTDMVGKNAHIVTRKITEVT